MKSVYGTTYSGRAYSLSHQLASDPNDPMASAIFGPVEETWLVWLGPVNGGVSANEQFPTFEAAADFIASS
jgi:hypothetical protein